MNPSAPKIWVRKFTFGRNSNYTYFLGWKKFYPQIYLIWDLRPPYAQWPFQQEKFTSEINNAITAFQNSFYVTNLNKQVNCLFIVILLVNHLIMVRFHVNHKVFSAGASFDLRACNAEGFIFKVTFSTAETWKCLIQTPLDLVLKLPLIFIQSGFDAVLTQYQALFCFSAHAASEGAGERTLPGELSPLTTGMLHTIGHHANYMKWRQKEAESEGPLEWWHLSSKKLSPVMGSWSAGEGQTPACPWEAAN